MANVKVARIPVGYANAFLLVNGSNSVMIDTGVKNHARYLLAIMKFHGLAPEDLALIIQTHTHFDHAGSTAKLKELTGAKVMVHQEEAESLRDGYTPIPNGTNIYTNFLAKLGRKVYPGLAAYQAVEPDIITTDNYSLAEWDIDAYVLHTPGHTDGSQSVIIEDRIIIAGDCFFPVHLNSVFTPFTNDIPLLMKSWEKLFALDINQFYAGHGGKFRIERAKKCYEERMNHQ